MTQAENGYLLDTHALLWALLDRTRLSTAVLTILEKRDVPVHISAVTAMELSTKVRIGKLPQAAPVLVNFETDMKDDGFAFLPLTIAHGLLAGSLKINHKDPFDRLLMAQSICDGLILISNETVFDSFGIRRIW
jgi:PIN domain nuclease of toxin-antitoxin system